MPPKEEPTGLFAKVVKFVKNPTTSWADLDRQEEDRESTYSKQMLKEMIERKRRNDFVRKREFDMLRKMRRSEVMAGQDLAGRPSFFQSSMPSKPDDRASTLKKIDEIEAQMSMQWWKTKHGQGSTVDSNPTSTNFPLSSPMPAEDAGRPPSPVAPLRSTSYIRTEPQPLADQIAKAAAPEPAPLLDIDPHAVSRREIDSTQPDSLGKATTAPTPIGNPSLSERRPSAPPVISAATPRGAQDVDVGGNSAFTQSKLHAIDVDEFAHDPELEEAAIRFANGDDAAAEAGLLEALSEKGGRADHDETWLTLFDLYRATGRQDRFETAAIDFAGRFSRSAPQWFSIPEAVGRMQATATAPTAAGVPATPSWAAPATLGTPSLAAMAAALDRAVPPWRLNWEKLTSIEPAAIERLTRQFTQWAAQPVQLRFIGAERLEQVLKAATPSGERGVDPAWWKLRMEVLRTMHRPDEFELVALEYCVTYEVSPPSWESARCEYKALQADGTSLAGQAVIADTLRDSAASSLGYSDTHVHAGANSQMSNVCTVELAGQVMGDANEALDTMENKLMGADVMVISCTRLIRVDFSAAGTLLNWVTARQAEGRQLQFVDVNRLVAAFFNVIGISEHARVITRSD